MSDKRRDSKGRLLKQGERQREDGKYEYRYYDEKGGRHSVYSWRLVDTDYICACCFLFLFSRCGKGKSESEEIWKMESKHTKQTGRR